MADTVDPDPPPPPIEVAVTTPTSALPPDAPPPRQGCMDKRSGLEKVLIVFVIIIIIICIGFLAAFLIFYFFASPPEGTCLTDDCVAAASRLKKYMDETVDPCNNFYEYACGSWLKDQLLDEDASKIDLATTIGDSNRIKIKSLLEEPPADEEPEYKEKAKTFYRACMDEAKLNERGTEPFTNLLSDVGSFPAMDSSWNETDFDLEATLVKLTKLVVMPLISVAVQRDLKDSTVNRIYISDAVLGLNSKTKYANGRDDPRIKHYEKWLVDSLVLLGVERKRARQDVKEVVDLEIQIAKLMRNDVDKADYSTKYNPMTIAMLQSKYPWLNWLEFFQGLASGDQGGGKIYLGVTELIINTEPAYLEQLGNLLKNTSTRVLSNYFLSHLIKFTSTLGSDFVALSDQFIQATMGTKPRPRWERCADETTTVFAESVSRMYVDNFFSKDAKSYMDTMIDDLTTSFGELLDENMWMEDVTKKHAEAKLDLMSSKVGYPDYLLDDDRLNALYTSISTDKGEYFETVVDYKHYVTLEHMKKLREAKDKTKWVVHPATVNAHYDILSNEIIFPAAFLQVPVYSPRYSSSINYGAAGTAIGAEMTKAFDKNGSQYDATGQLTGWWTDKDKDNFQSRSECFVDQYGCYKWDGYNIDGKLTLGENIADNGGLKQSYRAYRNLIRRRGGEEQRLPGLTLNHDQIFFLSFAQVWCAKIRDETKKEMVETDAHTPPPYRVYGTLQNSKDFAKAFNCPSGSRMNPMRKCVLW